MHEVSIARFLVKHKRLAGSGTYRVRLGYAVRTDRS